MGAFAEVNVQENCNCCGKVESQKFIITHFCEIPRPLLNPFADWIWLMNGETYCPSCWDKMVERSKKKE